MAELTPPLGILRVLCLQDPRILSTSLWAAHSAYTQADPLAGEAIVTPSTSHLVLGSSGTMTAATTIQATVLDPGLAGDGAFAWRAAPSGDYYGWETPITISGWECWEWDDGTSAGEVQSTYTPHSITLPSGRILCVVETIRDTGGGVLTYEVRCYRRDPSTAAISSVMVRQRSSAPTDGYHPCLAYDPETEIVYCLSWLERGTSAQIYVCSSKDEGATWSASTQHALDVAIDTASTPGAGHTGYALERIRACFGRGQVMLLVGLVANDTDGGVNRDATWHYVSVDCCSTFAKIGELPPNALGIGEGSLWFDLIWDGSAFVVAAIVTETQKPAIRRLPSADCPIDSWAGADCEDAIGMEVGGPWGEWTFDGTSYTLSDSDLSLVLADDGTIYLLGRLTVTEYLDECVILASRNGGRVWDPLSHLDIGGFPGMLGAWWSCGDASTHPADLAGTWQHGRIAVLHNWRANPGDEDHSLGCAYLGGYSSVTLPHSSGDWTIGALRRIASQTWIDQISYSITYLPLDLPGDCGWTVAGGGLQVIGAGVLGLSSIMAAIEYHQHPTGTIAEGVQAEFHVATLAGAAATNRDVYAEVILGDGAASYWVSVRMAAASFKVYDEFSGLAIATVAATLTGGAQFRIASAGGKASVYYRLGSESGEARAWIAVLEDTALTDGGAGTASHMIRFGHATANAQVSSWVFVGCSSDEWAASTLAAGQSNPSDLQGRLFGALPVYLSEGVSLRMEGGPAATGDAISVSTAYGYGIERMFPDIDLCPRRGWRSVDDSSQALIALRLDPSLTADSGPGRDLLSLWLVGTNIAQVYLQGLPFGGGWTTLQTIRTDYGFTAISYTRTGNTVQATGAASGAYVHEAELVGATFVHDSGVMRRILHNTEGSLGSGTVKATLILDGALVGDDAAGVAGSIRIPWVAGVVKLGGADYSAYRLRIDAHDTIDGDFRIGSMMLGWGQVLGMQPSASRAIETAPDRDETIAPDRTRVVRTRAPAQRTLEIAWADGVDMTGAFSGDPGYIAATVGGIGQASRAGLPSMLEGLVRDLAQPGKPCGYLVGVPQSGTSFVFNRRFQAIFGEVVSGLSVETIQGEEAHAAGGTEVVRIPKFTIREIV